MFSSIWKDTSRREPCGLRNQRIHFPTWCASEVEADCIQSILIAISSMISRILKIWEAINNVPDEEIWNTRQTMKHKLVDYIRKQFS